MPEIKDLPHLCRLIAVEMTIRTGELWRVIEHPDRWTHIESATACLSLRDDWRTHRLAIHATAPHGVQEKTTGETITANPNRQPEAIARDICARILDHARAHLIESHAWHTKKTHEEAAAHLRESIMRRFANEKYNGKLYRKSKDRNRRMWIDVNNYDHTATIEIHLPYTEALRLLKEIEKGEYIP